MDRLLKSSAIYTVGSLLRQVVSFLMLPIYTRHMSPSDYGVVEMLTVITSLLAVIAGVHIGQATIRYYHDASDEHGRKTVLSTAMLITLGSTFLVYVLFFAIMKTPAGPNVSRWILGDGSLTPLLLVFSLIIILQPIEEQLFTLMRLKNRPWSFVLISLGKLILQLSLNILFVVHFEMRAAGVVYSSIISTGVFGLVSFVYVFSYCGWKPSFNIGNKLVLFTYPLIFGAIGTLYMSMSDRYALQSLHGTDAVGIYALGYRFADILMIIGWLPFINVWQTHRFELSKTTNATQEYQRVFCAISVYLIWISLGIATLTDNVLHFLAAKDFWAAASVTPPLLLCSLLAAAIGFCSFSFLIKDRTSYIAKGTWISAITLTISYVVLIPKFGYLGAAWAKVIAAAVQLALTIRWSQKIYPMSLPWSNVSLLVSMAIILYACSLLVPAHNITSLAVEALLLAAFPIIALYAPLLESDKRYWLRSKIADSAQLAKSLIWR